MSETDFEHQLTVNRELIAILSGLLAAGDWESSLFLKVASKRIKVLRDEAERLLEQATVQESLIDGGIETLQEGYLRVFISLYQADGANLDKWCHTIKGLVLNNVGRPVYSTEDDVRSSIGARGNFSSEGYAVVHIELSELMSMPKEQVPEDRYGYSLLTLRENAVHLNNIKEFVHANDQRYRFCKDTLTLKFA